MTNLAESGTNPGTTVTARAGWRAPLALATVWLVVQAAVNSVSVANDLSRRGVAFEPGAPWIWEYSSALGLLACLLPVLVLDEHLRASVRSRGLRLVAYLGASVVFSIGHVTTMIALRHLAYALAGWRYDFGPWVDGLLYEYRKDALTFVLIVVIANGWRLLLAARAKPGSPEPPATAPEAPTFIVRTATQGDLLVRADEVDWVEAQGNYVALHVGAEVRLLRQTLAETEARLKEHGFIRTHRRALVNRRRMQAIIPPPRGDAGELGVRLSNGQIAPLSESRRAEVLRLVLGA